MTDPKTPAAPVVDEMAEGCCSASSPCFHQKHDPKTICEACRNAALAQQPRTEPAGEAVAAFPHKTYRCEWVVQLGEVDQYDQNFKPYSQEAFATREEAQRRLAEVSYVQDGSLRMVPKDAPHGYCSARLKYREVEVALRHPETPAPAGGDALVLPEDRSLPPMTDRGVAGQLMDAAWPHYGGNQQSSEFWCDFGEGVRFAAHYLAKPASEPAGGGVGEVVAIKEMFERWHSVYGFDEDSDADVDLYARVDDEIAALSAAPPAPAVGGDIRQVRFVKRESPPFTFDEDTPATENEERR